MQADVDDDNDAVLSAKLLCSAEEIMDEFRERSYEATESPLNPPRHIAPRSKHFYQQDRQRICEHESSLRSC